MDLSFNTNEDFNYTKTHITSIIKNTLDQCNVQLSENSIVNLSVHLTIAIIRIKSNNYIPLSNSQITSYQQEMNYPYAKTLCDHLAKEYNIEFPEAEISLVSMYLSKNQKLDLEINSGFDLLDDQVFNLLRETMDLIYHTYGKDFRSDDKLLIAVGLHLEPALERLMDHQIIENPLKDKIIERHPEEYNYSKLLNEIVTKKYDLSFNDDELAFITLHFAVANNRID